MGERDVRLSGRAYLEAVTALLQRARRQSPTTGLWEAGDLQWCWGRPRSSDGIDQLVVIDDQDQPLATVALTDWGDRWSAEPLIVPDRTDELLPRIWPRALEQLGGLNVATLETSVRDDDSFMAELAAAAGFARSSDRYAETWMAAPDRPAVPTLPDGYTLADRAADGRHPHHLIPRNGPDVAARLAQTSLYRPDLDLFVRDDHDEVAAYSLFWSDPVTGVGLVEPMRTEDAHQRRGLAGLVLREGLTRLVALGATRLKVSYELDNPASERLYLSAGFMPESTSTVWVRGTGA